MAKSIIWSNNQFGIWQKVSSDLLTVGPFAVWMFISLTIEPYCTWLKVKFTFPMTKGIIIKPF